MLSELFKNVGDVLMMRNCSYRSISLGIIFLALLFFGLYAYDVDAGQLVYDVLEFVAAEQPHR